MTEGLLLIGLAAWAGADMTAAGQFMISQPLVAAWLAGLIVGQPALGLGVGILLQVVWGGVLPLGGTTFPFSGPASAAAGALAGWTANGAPDAWPIAFPSAWDLGAVLGAALLAGEAGGRAVVFLRRRRSLAMGAVDAAAGRGAAAALFRLNARGAGEDALLGVVIAALGVLLGRLLLLGAEARPALDGAWVALAVAGFGVGGSLRALGASRGAGALLAVSLLAAAAWRLLA